MFMLQGEDRGGEVCPERLHPEQDFDTSQMRLAPET